MITSKNLAMSHHAGSYMSMTSYGTNRNIQLHNYITIYYEYGKILREIHKNLIKISLRLYIATYIHVKILKQTLIKLIDMHELDRKKIKSPISVICVYAFSF